MLSKDGMLNARHVHKLAILCTHSNIKFNYCAVAFTLWIWILVRTLEARKNFLRIIWTYKMRQQFFPWSIDPGGECIRSGFEIIQVLLVCWLALVLHYCNKSIRGQIFIGPIKVYPCQQLAVSLTQLVVTWFDLCWLGYFIKHCCICQCWGKVDLMVGVEVEVGVAVESWWWGRWSKRGCVIFRQISGDQL